MHPQKILGHTRPVKAIYWILESSVQEIKLILYEHYKGLTRNPQWLLMRKLGRFEVVRSIARFWTSNSGSAYGGAGTDKSSLFENLDVDQVVKGLRDNGLYLGIDLPQAMVAEILNFVGQTVCYGNRKPGFSFFYAQKEQAQLTYKTSFTLASYYDTAANCPAIHRLAQDPKLLEIAAKYLQAQPKHLGNQLWWSFAVEATPHDQRKAFQTFHYDLDDYQFLKFFFYLTDVDRSSGPHVCIRGSHRKKSFLHRFINRQYTEQALLDYYGADNAITICGAAGFGFVEDTFCFHKGAPPLHRDRLMLQIEFAARDYRMQADNFP